MKKMIVSIIAIVIFVGLSVGFYNASKLKSITIQKSVEINAPVEKVFEQVVYLENFPDWSPFLEADPTQKIEVKGTDGMVGAQYHWLGNKGKDLGFQEIKEIKPQQYIRMECDIQKPFQAKPVFEYTFTQSGGGTKVTQDFALESGLIDAYFMWVFNARTDMSKMNERGMQLLKQASEK